MNVEVFRDLFARWDRKNQSLMKGEPPDEIQRRWKWQRLVDGQGCERLAFGQLILSDTGLQDREQWWSWDRIAYVTYHVDKGATLALCLRGDPRLRPLKLGWLGFSTVKDWVRDGAQVACMALLRDCQDFVEAHGSKVYAKSDVPSMWWVHQPEARGS